MSYDRFLLGTSWMVGRYIHFDLQARMVTIQEGRCSNEFKRAEKKLTTESVIEAIRNPTVEASTQTTIAITVALFVGVLCFFCPFLL